MLGTAHELRSPLQVAYWQEISTLADTNQVIVPGSSVDNEDDDLPDDDTAASLLLFPSHDTLHTYTLSGLRLDGRRKNNSRTLYNILIRNGRKVVKR